MRRFYTILENVKLWFRLGFVAIMVMFVFTATTNYYYPNIEEIPEETNLLFDCIYFTLENLIVLSFCISAYNNKEHEWVKPMAIFGGAVTIVKLINECLYYLQIFRVNSILLLAFELIITLIILWRISRYYHSL